MKNRSPNYPQITLPSAIDLISLALKSGSRIPKAAFATLSSRSDSKGSTKSGAFQRKISALTQFNLIEVNNDTILISENAKKIVYSEIVDEVQSAKVDAFLAPTSFFDLYTSVAKEVPLNINALRSRAILDLNFTDKAAGNFVSNFIDSGVETGLIKYKDDGKQIVIISNLKNEEALAKHSVPTNEATQNEVKHQISATKEYEQSVINDNDYHHLSLSLSNGTFQLNIPKELTEQEKQTIKLLVLTLLGAKD